MSARLAGFPAYVSLSRLTTRSSGCSRSTWRTKLLPMKPAPPVTTSFMSVSTSCHFPNVFAGEVPRQPTLVARRRLGREVHVGEIDDATTPLADIAHAVGDARRNEQEARGVVASSISPTC